MKRRASAAPNALASLLQVLLVGVLLFAVVWQVRDAVPTMGDRPDSAQPGGGDAVRYLTTDEVNLRSGPGLKHPVLTVLPLHAQVTVTGPEQAGFLPVHVDGTAAWVAADYLATESAVRAASSGDLPIAEAPAPPRVAVPELLVANVSAAESDPVPAVPQEAQMGDEPSAAVVAVTGSDPGSGAPVAEAPGERWIEVDRSTKTVTLHEGDRVVARFPALLGRDPSQDGYYATAVGTFFVHVKEPALTETPFAQGVYLTDFVGFDPVRSNGFHSPTRDADGNIVQTGSTATQGCVRLGEVDARILFEFAQIGMRVEVHD